MRRHTLPLVERRERLADMKSLTLTVHLKPIGHAPSVGRARTSPAPTEGAVVLLSFSFFSFVTKTVFRQCEKSNKTRHDIKWIKIIFIEKSMITQAWSTADCGKVRTLKATLGTVGNTVNALTGSTWKYWSTKLFFFHSNFSFSFFLHQAERTLRESAKAFLC